MSEVSFSLDQFNQPAPEAPAGTRPTTMHPSPPSSPSRASSPRAVLAPLDTNMPSDDEDASWSLNSPERDRKDQADWYDQYAKVLDEDGNDISQHAPPALKVFWAHTYHTLAWEMRKARRDYGKEEASDRFNLLAQMKDWYVGLVQQEASVSRLMQPARRR